MATLGSKQLKQGKENQKHQVSDEPEAYEVGEWVVLEMKVGSCKLMIIQKPYLKSSCIYH